MFQKWNVQRLSSTHSGLFLQFFCGFPEQPETFTSVVKQSDLLLLLLLLDWKLCQLEGWQWMDGWTKMKTLWLAFATWSHEALDQLEYLFPSQQFNSNSPLPPSWRQSYLFISAAIYQNQAISVIISHWAWMRSDQQMFPIYLTLVSSVSTAKDRHRWQDTASSHAPIHIRVT